MVRPAHDDGAGAATRCDDGCAAVAVRVGRPSAGILLLTLKMMLMLKMLWLLLVMRGLPVGRAAMQNAWMCRSRCDGGHECRRRNAQLAGWKPDVALGGLHPDILGEWRFQPWPYALACQPSR
mmetsp:Transcript_21126/g.45802  ORF Transcript_21126/g.45802 Transcript_21126/m.45802 type:complete len:123 (-) Transcript_21126:608-976(-)